MSLTATEEHDEFLILEEKHKELLAWSKDVYSTGRYSDLTLTCGGRTFRVHKVFLDGISKVFRTMLSGPFKEATEQHDTIELHDDPDALKAFIHFVYHDDYDDSFISGDDCKRMYFAVKVYAISDKYDVLKLRLMAAGTFKCFFKRAIVLPKRLSELTPILVFIQHYTNPQDRILIDIIRPELRKNIMELLQFDEFKEVILRDDQLARELFSLLSNITEDLTKSVEPTTANQIVSKNAAASHFPFGMD